MTTTKARLSHKQIVAKAEETLAVTQREQAEVQADLAGVVAEIVALEKQVAQREVDLAARQRKVEQLREGFLANCSYEAFARDGLAAEPSRALLAQEKFLRTEEAALIALEEQAAAEEAADTERLAALHALQTDRQRRLVELARQHDITVKVKEEAIARAGQEAYEQIVSQLGLLQAALQERQDDVKLAEEKIDTFAASALQQLSEFPDFLPQLRQALPFEDSVTAVLQSLISYIQMLLLQGAHLPSDLALPGSYETLWHLLCIPDTEIYSYDHIGSNSPSLRLRLEYVQRLLAYYREERVRRTV